MVYQLSFERLIQNKSKDSVVLPVLLKLGELEPAWRSSTPT